MKRCEWSKNGNEEKVVKSRFLSAYFNTKLLEHLRPNFPNSWIRTRARPSLLSRESSCTTSCHCCLKSCSATWESCHCCPCSRQYCIKSRLAQRVVTVVFAIVTAVFAVVIAVCRVVSGTCEVVSATYGVISATYGVITAVCRVVIKTCLTNSNSCLSLLPEESSLLHSK